MKRNALSNAIAHVLSAIRSSLVARETDAALQTTHGYLDANRGFAEYHLVRYYLGPRDSALTLRRESIFGDDGWPGPTRLIDEARMPPQLRGVMTPWPGCVIVRASPYTGEGR